MLSRSQTIKQELGIGKSRKKLQQHVVSGPSKNVCGCIHKFTWCVWGGQCSWGNDIWAPDRRQSPPLSPQTRYLTTESLLKNRIIGSFPSLVPMDLIRKALQ
jgi:hypothetical protein